MGIEVGISINSHGKRLFFQDLKFGELVLADYSTDSLIDYKVCKIISFYENVDGKNVELDDGSNTPSLGNLSFTEKELAGNDEKKWLFELPKNYREV